MPGLARAEKSEGETMQESNLVSESSEGENHEGHQSGRLGFFLCWAVVFADIGTSLYYVPGILYGQVGKRAGFFVLLTMIVFVLLALKYAEVTHRYPQGGGVVTVASKTLRPWAGALGGMLEMGDYFLTAAISALSGLTYFSIVVPASPRTVFFGTLVVLVLLGLLNWWGISESARVSAVGAVIALVSDLLILLQILIHVPLSTILSLIPEMFQGKPLTGVALLTGFAGSFLAFSGLESISQLSPVMKSPRKRTGRLALLAVVATVGLTSPLLTLFATTLLDASKVNPDQFISLLGGEFGGQVLGIEVAISASALLIFASNTAIIGCYHVFLALSRMHYLPAQVQRRNRWRGTPHYAIALATGFPIFILVLVQGNIVLLGDMYAFGLLGAFSLTCVGVDIARWRDRKTHQQHKELHAKLGSSVVDAASLGVEAVIPGPNQPFVAPVSLPAFVLGLLTTGLVILAWCTNLVSKPPATAFGGSITLLGLATAYVTATYFSRRGRWLGLPATVYGAQPQSILAVLSSTPEGREATIYAACKEARNNEVVFLYRQTPTARRRLELFENADPYLNDEEAKQAFSEAETIAKQYNVKRRYVYAPDTPDVIFQHWQMLQPRDTILVAKDRPVAFPLSPDRVRHSLGPGGQVMHYLKNWQAHPVLEA
jgi:amino acid transporter